MLLRFSDCSAVWKTTDWQIKGTLFKSKSLRKNETGKWKDWVTHIDELKPSLYDIN
jgi:hypothetical protein